MKKIILMIVFLTVLQVLNLQLLYSQSGKIHFTNVGQETHTRVGCNTHGSGFFDYNGDGLPDIFVVHNESYGGWANRNIPHTLLKNMGNGTFKNVTSDARVGGYNTSAQGFAAADYDNDGRRDLAIAMGYNLHGRILLYWQGEKNKFYDATDASRVGHKNRGRNLVFVDYQNDGLLDLLSFGDSGFNSPSLLVYKNIGSAKFILQSEQAGLNHTRDPQDLWGCAFADIDNDGDMDFFSANHVTKCHLFVNNGNGTFSEETTERGIVKQNKFYGAIFFDYNNDGWFDLFTRRCNLKSILYKNNKDGTFSDVTSESGLWTILSKAPYGGGLSVADFNNDGFIDILAITTYSSNFRLYQNNGDGTFTNVAKSANIKENTKYNYSAPIADYNQDGYLDFYLARCDSYPPDYYATLYENSGGTNHWIHVKLIGIESNREAIGARVVAYTNGKLQVRQVLGGDGYKMDSLPVEFGLAGNCVVDSLVIYWPSGIVQREMLVSADTLITIEEEERVYYHNHIISGDIDYYEQNKKVPSVQLKMTGTSSTTALSNQNGSYKFPVDRGDNTLDITPSKTADLDVGECTISAYDAGLTAQSAEGIKALTGISAKAADVNDNKLIDAMDVLLIAQKAVGLSNSTESFAGDWRFDPLKIHIDGIIESNIEDQDFTAWILGDVNGDWAQTIGLEKNLVSMDSESPQYTQSDSTVSIALTLPGNVLMLSSDLWLEYDPSLFKVHDIQKTSLTDDFELVYNDGTPGILKIALFNSVPIWGEDEFLQIIFDIIPEVIEDTTHLQWRHYRINDTEYDKEDIIFDLRTFSLSGNVKYYQNNIFVPGVTLSLSGAKEEQIITNSGGIYQFIGIKVGESAFVTPSKAEGEDMGELVISAYDAFLAARHSVNIEHLSGLKIEAADVDKNGKVEISDAEGIATASVGFTNSESHAGAWGFSPSSYSYSNITEDVEKNFLAYILGDINGDWLPGQSAQSGRVAKDQKKVTEDNVLATTAYEFSIPLILDEGDSLGSADVWGEYDESALELIDIKKSERFKNFYLIYNDSIPGIFKIAMFGTKFVKDENAFITLYFRVITKEKEETSLNWKYFRINNSEYNKNNIKIDTGVNDYSYSGEILFYQDSIGVGDTKLQMQGTANKECFTDSYGYYTFAEVSKSDSIIVTPSKERNEDVGFFTISAYDAVLTARHSVGLDSLSGYKLKAADVDTNGIVDMLDAVFIAKRSVGIIDSEFSQAGAWRFFPDSRSCSYIFENIVDGNFTAYILGDINGDWEQNSKTGKAVMMSSARTLSTGGSNEFCLPLVLENDTSLISANICLKYDRSVLELVDIKKDTAFEKFHLIYNNSIPGEIKIALFGVEPEIGKQEFINIYFKFISYRQQEAEVNYVYWCINNNEYNKDKIIIHTGIDGEPETRLNFKLHSNYPNPFNPETIINYQIEKKGQVQMIIYNSKGQAVRCLVDKFQNRGKYSVEWKGLDDNGKPVGSGLYFCRLSCDEKVSVIKMVKLK